VRLQDRARVAAAVLVVLAAVSLSSCLTEQPLSIATNPPTDCGLTSPEPMRLAGDPEAADPVWLVGTDTGRRYSVRWPTGYTAVYRPPIEIRNRAGATVARTGDVLVVDATIMDASLISICAIARVNGIALPAEPMPTAVPVPTRRPSDVPPPVGRGTVDLEICGETDDGMQVVEQYVIRFEPLEGQPTSVFPVEDGDCDRHTYSVWAGRYVVEVTARGWQRYRTDPISILPGDATGGFFAIGLRRDEP
jgi:hypothetical protein